MSALSAWTPTLPVPNWTTGMAMSRLLSGCGSQVRDGDVEIGEGEAAVDL